MEQKDQPIDEIRSYIGRGRAKKAAHEGNVQEGLFYAGAGAAMVEDVITVKELFDQILAEYKEAVGRAASMMAPAPRYTQEEEADETAVLYKSHG
jgi:enoyl-[acyl-carrier protein] reductase II